MELMARKVQWVLLAIQQLMTKHFLLGVLAY
jgi:hypothetical protein